MKVIKTVSELKSIQTIYAKETLFGFVPTMGCLHEGHGALIRRAKNDNDVVILSLFVNPTQFNDQADYEKYPKTLDSDMAFAKSLGVDYLFIPEKDTIYPNGHHITIEVNHPISLLMEGKHRPGHFNGVLTVVLKLLLLVNPNNAYFGEKDFQQYYLIKELTQAYFLRTVIIPCPTVRESSGLAMSSRNKRLSAAGRELADKMATIFLTAATDTISSVRERLESSHIQVEYLEKYEDRVYLAAFIEDVRLIDNITCSK